MVCYIKQVIFTIGNSGVYVIFGRALGYINGSILDIHGAGAQRSSYKLDVQSTMGASSGVLSGNTIYYFGPQGDILQDGNSDDETISPMFARCVRTEMVY